MEGFDFLEETTFEDELDVDPQDDWEYQLDNRDDYGRYLNKYGDIRYVRQDMPTMRNNTFYSGEIDPFDYDDDILDDEIKIDNFYKTQKVRFWNGDYRAIYYSSEHAEFYFDEKTGQLYAFKKDKKS